MLRPSGVPGVTHASTCCSRSPLFCVLPPYVLDRIVERASSARRRRIALRTLRLDNTFRAGRTAALEALRAGRRRRLMDRILEVASTPQKDRRIFDGGNIQRIPGTLVRSEGTASKGDREADEAFDGLGHTFNLYWEQFERNSIDARGLRLDATVHFGQDYDNAYWDGRRMIFGDGDGDLFNPFTRSIDVIGHELTHGVVQYTCKLIYWSQSGALNEHVADAFGSLVKQYAKGQTAASADWLVGAELLTPQVQGVALRSMKAPGTAFNDPLLGKDPQPDHMNKYVKTLEDNMGVHINSGIPNKAFYLVAKALGGNAWDTAGPIWYQTITSPALRPRATFRTFAQITMSSARQVFPGDGTVEAAVRDSWAQVGLAVT
jgi:Zn-dependent metalloprotease